MFVVAGYFHITLLAYTGLRDPVWKIRQCVNSDIPYLLLQAKNCGHVYQHRCIPPRTGYKGFLIQDTEGEQLIVGPETTQLQLLLLDTMPCELPPIGDYRQRIRSVIASGNVAADCSVAVNVSGNETEYCLPDDWNTDENITRKNNCYNYAATIVTNTYAQPGSESGEIYSHVSADAIRDAAVRDGWFVLSPRPAANESYPEVPDEYLYVVALFIAPG